MKKTIELTPNNSKWIFIFNGLVITGVGLRQLATADTWTSWDAAFGIFLLIGGLASLIHGLILFSKNSKLTPSVQVDDNGIVIKESIYKTQRQMAWKNVSGITYKPFELSFHMTDDNTEIMTLSTSGQKSLDIKKAIREFAADRHIIIVGG